MTNAARRVRLVPVLFGALLFASLTPTAVLADAPCPDGSTPATALSPDDASRAVRCLVNAERASRDRSLLRPNPQLRVAAEGHAQDMVEHAFFAHVSAERGALTARARRAGYIGRHSDWAVGENIAWGQTSLTTPASIVVAWMHSPAHRAVILEPGYRDAGVAVLEGLPFRGSTLPGATFVLDVGTRG